MLLQLYYGNKRELLQNELCDIGDKEISPKMLLKKINATLPGVFTIDHAQWVIDKKNEDHPEWWSIEERRGSNFWGIKIVVETAMESK